MAGIARETIANGVDFIAVRDSRFKQNFLSVNFMFPLKKETASVNALLPMLLKKGCAEYPDMTAVNRRLKELYGAALDSGVAKRGEIQVLSLSCEMLSQNYALKGESVLGKCASLLKSMIFEPAADNGIFPEKEIEIERKNLVDLIDSRLNDKRVYANQRLKEEMCAGEAYGLSDLGDKDSAQAVTAQNLADAWNRMKTNAPVQILCVGAGEEAANACRELFREAFAGIKRGELFDCGTEVIREAGEVKKVVDRLPVSQGKLVMGFRAGVSAADSQAPAMQLACALFGGSPHSKLFKIVREKMSLCYYCISRFEQLKGLMLVDSGIEQQNYEKVTGEVERQLREVQNGNFSDDEILSAALSLQNSYHELSDSLSGLNSWYLGRAIMGDLKTPDEAAAEIAGLGRQDILNAVRGIRLDTVYLLEGEEEGGASDEV